MASFSAYEVPADDFRLDYLRESRLCMREALKIQGKDKKWPERPEYWANLIGGLFNATVASVSDSVAFGLESEQDHEREKQRVLHKHILDKLDARS